jgi:hypothetical protein
LAGTEPDATALERIANCLESLAPEQTSEAPETPPCSHPTECRIDLGMTDGQPDWVCSICRFQPSQHSDPETTTLGHR